MQANRHKKRKPADITSTGPPEKTKNSTKLYRYDVLSIKRFNCKMKIMHFFAKFLEITIFTASFIHYFHTICTIKQKKSLLLATMTFFTYFCRSTNKVKEYEY